MIEWQNLYGESFLHRKENNSFSTSFIYYTKVAWRNMSFKFNHLSSLGYVCWVRIMYVNCRELSVKLKKRWKIGKFLFLIRQVSREFVRRHNGSKSFQQFYFHAHVCSQFFLNIDTTIALKSDWWNFVKTQGTK